MKSKKANLYLPVIVLLTFIFLTLFAVLVYLDKNDDINEKVGYKSAVIINTYNEGERMMFYLKKSVEYSNEEAWSNLYKNGGYSSLDNCEIKVQDLAGNNYNLWNTCEPLKINKEYSLALKNNLNKYINSYSSAYVNVMDKEKQKENNFNNYNNVLTKIFKENIKLNKVYTKDNKLIISFSPLILKSEDSASSYEIKEPRFYVQVPDLTIFTRVYSIISICKEMQNSVEVCKRNIKSSFQDAVVETDNKILKINIPVNNPIITSQKYQLLIAVDLSKDLQGTEQIDMNSFSYKVYPIN
jgi:hypothetical protein